MRKILFILQLKTICNEKEQKEILSGNKKLSPDIFIERGNSIAGNIKSFVPASYINREKIYI